MSLKRPDLNLQSYAAALLDGHIEPPPEYTPPPAPAEMYRTPHVKISPDIAAVLDSLLDIDEPIPADTLQAAIEAGNHMHERTMRTKELEDIAAINRNRVFEKRDALRNGELITDPAMAKARLKELAVQEKFMVPDVLARNMSVMCSYYNSKPNDKNFKTTRTEGPTSPMLIKRTR